MSRFFSEVAAVIVVLLLSISCAGHNLLRDPIKPPENHHNFPTSTASQSSGHQLWAFNYLYIDPSSGTIEVIPMRTPMFHMNVLSYLEYGPCTYCVSVVGFREAPQGTHEVDIRLRHPFTLKNFTGFDVRGIVMFTGSGFFPCAGESGLNVSHRFLGDGQVLNPDGFTALYNPSTVDYAPFMGYLHGRLASPDIPDAQLNAYKRFISDPSSQRAVFEAGDQVMVTYNLHLPLAPLVLGYAVDASWAHPINNPVWDPWTDFGPEANCPEAWKIEVTEAPGSYLTECGGSVALTIDVYDWQEPDPSHDVKVECPDLFDGEVTARVIQYGPDYSRYEAVVDNSKCANDGEYMCLISKGEDPPPGRPWMDQTAYQIITLEVDYGSDPANPIELKVVPTPENTSDIAVSGGIACVRSSDTLSIIDINPVEDAQVVRQMDFEYTHGLALYDSYLFLATASPGLQIIDIHVPEEATLVKTVETTGYARDVAISGGYAFVTTKWTGMDIIDIDPVEEAHVINTVQVMEGEESNAIAVSDGYAYVTPLTSAMVILDIDPPEDAHVVNTVDYNGGPTDVCVSDGYAYVGCVAGLLTAGSLHIIDIDPPEEAYKINTVFVADPVQRLDVSCGYAYLADAGEDREGMVIVDIDPPEDAHVTKLFPGVECAYGVAVAGPLAFVTDPNIGLRIFRLWYY